MALPSTSLLSCADYGALKHSIVTQTDSHRKKVDILFDSRGHLNSGQVADILRTIQSPVDKVRAIQVLSPRLCRMSCAEGAEVIGSLAIHNDKLTALNCIKRALTDCQTPRGKGEILNAFAYEQDKLRALRILHTVRSDMHNEVPAGGHQGYGAVGGLFQQSRPMDTTLYGPIHKQRERMPGQGPIKIPSTARPGVIPSMYTGHPSYAYPPDTSYLQTSHFPESPPPAAAATVTGAFTSSGGVRVHRGPTRGPWPEPPARFDSNPRGFPGGIPPPTGGYPGFSPPSSGSRPSGGCMPLWSTPPMAFEHVYGRSARQSGTAGVFCQRLPSLAPGAAGEY